VENENVLEEVASIFKLEIFNPEDESRIFLQNISIHIQNCMVSKPRRSQYEQSPS
jgi:hypothetical protein